MKEVESAQHHSKDGDMSGQQNLSTLRVATIIMVGTMMAAGITSAVASPESDACNGSGPQYSLDQRIGGCTALIAQNANDADAFFNRGLAYKQKGQYDQAIEDYTSSIALKPGGADAFLGRGNAYYGKGQYDLAIADYQQALRLDPNNKDAGDASLMAEEAKAAAH
jgi:tetratricopeptide (TPR) repeat protein